MLKSKKQSKAEGKVPKPIKIKKEKTEEERTLQPMSHYVDDRLELVKQIFGTLKPKTITNLAPDFLKQKALEEIEELCLNELICISKKRLLSIINATPCPSDTESSEDSDVQHQEEHVSLEEISSDSEIEGASAKSSKKRTSGVRNADANKKNAKKSSENNNDSEVVSSGRVSVLELLELQARARAIRSQLALEPVTKIEVDSDDNDTTAKSTQTKDNKKDASAQKKSKDTKAAKETKDKRSDRKRKSIEAADDSLNQAVDVNVAAGDVQNTTSDDTATNSKKIKLKRNYRNANQVTSTDMDITSAEGAASKSGSASAQDVKREENKPRSPSPDVIPIIPEQETLLISDSSEDEEPNASNAKDQSAVQVVTGTAETKGADTSISVAERKRKKSESEEGELSDGEIDDDNEKDEEHEKMPSSTVNDGNADPASAQNVSKLSENDNSKTESITADAKNNANETAGKPLDSNDASALHNNGKSSASTTNDTATATEINKNKRNDAKDVSPKATQAAPEVVTAANRAHVKAAKSANKDDEDDDVIEDVISIGGDIERDMIESLDEETNTTDSFSSTQKAHKNGTTEDRDDDVIHLDTSEEEKKDSTESWHARYLKSSKVSKVLAASRLGKRVRDRIKNSKHAKPEAAASVTTDETTTEAFSSKHEDGSVEQYKELLEMRQRKAT